MKKIIALVVFFILMITVNAQTTKGMKTALILIDIQNDYFPGGKMELSNPEEASKNAGEILEEFRRRDLPVIHIKHESIRSGASFFIPNTRGVEIHDEVRPIEGERIVTKHYPNSFRDTDLLNTLRELKVERLVIGGMMTHMCVDATTRAAKDYGFECIVIGDACATKDLEFEGKMVNSNNVQRSFLAALSYYYSTVMTTEAFLSENAIGED